MLLFGVRGVYGVLLFGVRSVYGVLLFGVRGVCVYLMLILVTLNYFQA